ncbi:tyrosine-type recombinase/integrase [Roseateles flavus]|uniref:Integrase arm-type DNA-binding domain-containing protein n=1 Tax=Roseateles flavus TaxID=3149041 RepID=A0ABV0GHU5_9BURK
MRALKYTLSPTRINNAKAKSKAYKLSDGGGLYVDISPGGGKTWRFQYRLDGLRHTVSIGKYPEIGVADARDRHFELRVLVERGINPAEVQRKEQDERKLRAAASRAPENGFEAMSRRWLTERMSSKSETYRNQMLSLLERFVWPEIGSKQLSEVRPAHVLKMVEARQATPRTAENVRTVIQKVFDFAIQKLEVETNPALPLRGAVEVPAAVHHRHLNERELVAFWRSLEKQGAHFVTIAATKMLFYTMLRKNEVLKAKWSEIDLDRGIWDVPGERMKMKKIHRVFLSSQASELLNLLLVTDDRREYVFPSVLRPGLPVGEATLNHLFWRMDFGVPEFAPHGTRGTTATLLREHGFSRDVVELLLAHGERGVAASYHHHEMAEERRRALQYLADEINRLVTGDRKVGFSEIGTSSTLVKEEGFSGAV